MFVYHLRSLLLLFYSGLQPDPSGHARKGLGNNLALKCLAGLSGMPWFLNPANFDLRSQRDWSSPTQYYQLADVAFFFLLININSSFPVLKTLLGKGIAQTHPHAARRVWGPDSLVPRLSVGTRLGSRLLQSLGTKLLPYY